MKKNHIVLKTRRPFNDEKVVRIIYKKRTESDIRTPRRPVFKWGTAVLKEQSNVQQSNIRDYTRLKRFKCISQNAQP